MDSYNHANWTNFMRGGLGGSAGADTSLLGGGAVLDFRPWESKPSVWEGASMHRLALLSGRGGGGSSSGVSSFGTWFISTTIGSVPIMVY